MKCNNCGYDYLDTSPYCTKCGENNPNLNRKDTKDREIQENKKYSRQTYHLLINKLKLLHEESLWEGDADFDYTVDLVENDIYDALDEIENLQDYIILHDDWKNRDRAFYTTCRRSFMIIHKEISNQINNLESSTVIQDPYDLMLEYLDESILTSAFDAGLISDTGEIHPLGYTEYPTVYTSLFEGYDYQIKTKKCDDLLLKECITLNDEERFKIILDQARFDIKLDLSQYDVIFIDEFYRADAYVFIPLPNIISKEDLQRDLVFVDKESIWIGATYKNNFYKRNDIWMSFNDRDLNEVQRVSLIEFIEMEFIE